MNGDLNLSGSLGGLRIANPDGAFPDIAKPVSTSDSLTPAVSTISNPLTQNDALSQLRKEDRSPVSPMKTSPLTSAPLRPSPSSSQPKESYLNRKQKRQSIPVTYQDQQQAQFPQFPTMMPQNLHNHQTNTTRPVSTFYTQTPPTSNLINRIAREGSYRTGNDSAGLDSVPWRSSLRGSSAALQAGVPTRDESHRDRNYKQTGQCSSDNGPVPLKRTSRGFSGGRMSGSPGNGNTPLSSSPYGMEGGRYPVAKNEKIEELR